MRGTEGIRLDRKKHAFAGAVNMKCRSLAYSGGVASTSERKYLSSRWNYIMVMIGRDIDLEYNDKAVRFQPTERMTTEANRV